MFPRIPPLPADPAGRHPPIPRLRQYFTRSCSSYCPSQAWKHIGRKAGAPSTLRAQDKGAPPCLPLLPGSTRTWTAPRSIWAFPPHLMAHLLQAFTSLQSPQGGWGPLSHRRPRPSAVAFRRQPGCDPGVGAALAPVGTSRAYLAQHRAAAGQASVK